MSIIRTSRVSLTFLVHSVAGKGLMQREMKRKLKDWWCSVLHVLFPFYLNIVCEIYW